MTQELEVRILRKVDDILLPPRKEIVHAQHFVTLRQQAFTQMGTDEPGAPGDKYAAAGTGLGHCRRVVAGKLEYAGNVRKSMSTRAIFAQVAAR
jgi:hypothetical protein